MWRGPYIGMAAIGAGIATVGGSLDSDLPSQDSPGEVVLEWREENPRESPHEPLLEDRLRIRERLVSDEASFVATHAAVAYASESHCVGTCVEKEVVDRNPTA